MAESTAPAPGDGTDAAHTLRGHIGIPGVVFLVVAAAAPLTVVAGALPVMLAIANGPGARWPTSWSPSCCCCSASATPR